MNVSLGSLIKSSIVIPSGQTTSNPVSTEGMSLCGIQLPPVFTGTTVTFLVATVLSGPYQPMSNKAGPVTYTVAAGGYIAIDPVDFYGVSYFELVSSATEAATRTLTASLKGI